VRLADLAPVVDPVRAPHQGGSYPFIATAVQSGSGAHIGIAVTVGQPDSFADPDPYSHTDSDPNADLDADG
jgi:hypothetical protein